MIDADGFKQINDNYGHDAGDEVLKQLSKVLSHAVRNDDIVCRLGGDEFLIICPDTSVNGALLVANKMREKVANLRVPVNGGEWIGSVSVGVAVRTSTMQSLEELIKASDEGLYIAKLNGRNRVECSSAS
jgi:hemerythrin